MEEYNWWKIFNTDEFDALGIPSRNYTLDAEDLGIKEFLVCKGIGYSILYEENYICLEMNDNNPNEFEGYAIYRDSNNDVFFGILIDET